MILVEINFVFDLSMMKYLNPLPLIIPLCIELHCEIDEFPAAKKILIINNLMQT